MVRQPRRRDVEDLQQSLIGLLENFGDLLESGTLREKVHSLISAHHALRDLGRSLMLDESGSSARDRILSYFRAYPGQVIAGDELMVVAGISESARRIRELRVEFGWKIITGMTIRTIGEDEEAAVLKSRDLPKMEPDDYMLVLEQRDRDGAFRWNVANDIRKSNRSVKAKILRYLRKNVGEQISGEELSYLAHKKTEWARRVRELRTEDGWPIATRQTGNPNLAVGIYVLERDRQAPTHDRTISDYVRVQVLKRDGYRCRGTFDDGKRCGWHPDEWSRADSRFLELHHVIGHAAGGSNEAENLITVCNVCHDEIHRRAGRPPD